jgi:hypothetical protein
MDDRRFDSITRSIGTSRTRRDALKGLLGIGAGTVAAGALLGQRTEAARRGFSGPVFPTWTPCVRDSNGVCCRSGVVAEGVCCSKGYVSGQGYCCDPDDPGAPYIGHCCPVSPSGEVIGECVG